MAARNEGRLTLRCPRKCYNSEIKRLDGCVKGAAGGMYRNNVAGPLWDVSMTKETDMRCKKKHVF